MQVKIHLSEVKRLVGVLIPILALSLAVIFGLLWLRHSASKIKSDKSQEAKQTEVTKLLDESESNIEIATDLDSRFFHKDSEILKKLVEASERGVQVKILYDPRVGGKELEGLKNVEEKENIEFKKANSNLSYHYWIFDDESVRMDNHPFQKFGKEGVPGVIFQNQRRAIIASETFSRMWNT